MLSVSIEDYIKTIHYLEAEHQRATTRRIAQALNVRMASVTGMIKHLAAEGYVRHKPYQGARLTEKGRTVAINLIRRHRLIELFLSQTLGLSWDELHDDAEALEHHVSDRLIERIDEYLGGPEFDPHGSPIPDKKGRLPAHEGVAIADLTPGQSGRVVEVADSDPEFLRYLTGLKIEIGSTLNLVDIAPFDGPITLVLGKSRIAIGPEAARRVYVKPTDLPSTRKRH